MRAHAVPDAAVLLQTEHAVVRVLASTEGEEEVYPALLKAIGGSLGWTGGEVLEGAIPRAVAESGTVAFPAGARTLRFSGPDPGPATLATLDSLGSQIGVFVERCRAQAAVRASDARKGAILEAAFDAIVTMDHEGNVVEANRAAEAMFGYTFAEMAGGELAELIVPPSLREAHRHGVRRLLELGERHVLSHPTELTGMRSDGSEFPVEVIVTQPDLPGPPVFVGHLRDVTERHAAEAALRRLADEQAALRRVATAVAAETEPRTLFGLVIEEVGRLMEAQSANMIRYDGEALATVIGAWNAEGVRSVPVGATVRVDGDTASARVWRTGLPSRVDTYEGQEGELADTLRELGFRSAIAAPVVFGGRLWGAVIVSSVDPEPFPEGAEQRIADFAELVAQALANAEARAQLAASRARIVQAGDAERRRLERNLHDGAQQRLVSLSLTLRLAARRHGGDPELLRAGEELAQALEELRELARGIHPAVLTEYGLEPAIRALATRATVPVDLDVELDERLPAPVEAAAYYVVAEALTNVAKYAQASGAHVHVFRDERSGDEASGRGRRRAVVEVRDDGVGGAQESGSGLRGLADRVEALGGALWLNSPAGEGTTLLAEMPVEP
ncbi:PAS domain S-box protein [Candidatus Solirubrobacter pratensis]|uniref:PAS domain S-box protein n=1 Tax=Candidatus Solirubrobacter pratensis TaxID=1298857 RepID=UPI00040F2D39|nr:PAS domain S-box protein [Candidatus Solirubrobacter pratensis]